MIYFFLAFTLFIFFLNTQTDKRSSVKYLVGTVLSYFFAIVFMILYFSRDIRYYNIIEDYFMLPQYLWKKLMFFRISKNIIIRGMNTASLLTIFLGCQYSMKYLNQHGNSDKVLLSRFRTGISVYLILELIYYDPAFTKALYLFLYPSFLSAGQYERLCTIIHQFTVLINCILVTVSCINLLLVTRKIRFFPAFHYYAYGEIFSYILIMISYLFLFFQLPTHMVRVSSVSGYVSYHSLTLYSHQFLYTVFPYYLLFASVLMCICALSIKAFSRKLNQKEFTISGQIDAVNTSSKAFCHYIKNELLAIEAEALLLDIPPEKQDDLNHIVERCQNLYGRLDVLHRSTKLGRLTMEHTNLEALVRSMLIRMAPELKEYHISFRKLDNIPEVLLDRNYFEQAIHNIITNAIDAMKDLPSEQKNLTFTIRAIDNWVAFSITDTGCGIPPENIQHIFDPFFSSQPISRHWGIGMTTTYQIIQAHNGKISVESQVGKGTTFRILLPNLKKLLP